jgi:hypothetical protein
MLGRKFLIVLVLFAFVLPLAHVSSIALAQDVADGRLVSSGPFVSCMMRQGTGDPPTTSSSSLRFVAREYFIQNVGGDATVRILWIGATFRERFVTRVEDRRDDINLRPFELRAPLLSGEIVTQLGETAETSLGDLWCLLSQQPAGEAGVLAIGGPHNLFYMRDDAGTLHMIDVVWGGAGWEIGASRLDRDTPWPVRSRVFGR